MMASKAKETIWHVSPMVNLLTLFPYTNYNMELRYSTPTSLQSTKSSLHTLSNSIPTTNYL